MSLESKIANDLKEAMKNKDQAAMRTLRSIKAAILLFKTDGSGNVLDEQAEIKLLQKLVKQRQDSLDIYTKQGRDDLATTEREEIEVLQKYLPKPLTQEELNDAICAIIAETGVTSIKEMGKVIGVANQKLAGQADGKTIAATVKALLG
ncbi:MAG: GatB/YqeY domain-containing protein [Saprospiraceae bacterium]|nr:MAG: aspartyl-tRNA amidotransferase subunit B [Bacteroidetes bacterium OLB9]MCO6464687.1 GatB/YqeY domain-containing protein [Saprospiraceae bacterium]MCZ2339667.1 GatB/YqeY domain-containing protein [Chitinophagales bacterium]